MKKYLGLIIIILLCAFSFGCANPPAASPQDEEAVVKALAEDFGQKLKSVSLLLPAADLAQSMEENYGPLVTPELLQKWQNDPQNAPGRMVSSPWPDRIEIQSVTKEADGSYTVAADIIELTSVEVGSGGYAAKQPITLTVKKIDDKFLIAGFSAGDYEEAKVVYTNDDYGFELNLPLSWRGYTLVTDSWQGMSLNEKGENEPSASGPLLSVRHPQWTEAVPRQDIPIMVFTLKQWQDMQNDVFHIGAAPIGPSELGRNSAYVFGLPARYNFSYLEGYEEVDDILTGGSLKTTENINVAPQ